MQANTTRPRGPAMYAQVALKPTWVLEIQNTYVHEVLQLNCNFPEGSLLILNPTSSSLILFLPLISLEETGNKFNLSSPLWQSYFTKLHQLLFSQSSFPGKKALIHLITAHIPHLQHPHWRTDLQMNTKALKGLNLAADTAMSSQSQAGWWFFPLRWGMHASLDLC